MSYITESTTTGCNEHYLFCKYHLGNILYLRGTAFLIRSEDAEIWEERNRDILQCMQIPKLSPTNDLTMDIRGDAATIQMVRKTQNWLLPI